MASQVTGVVESKEQRRLLLALVAAIFMINLDTRVVTPLLPTIAADLRTTVAATGSIVTCPGSIFHHSIRICRRALSSMPVLAVWNIRSDTRLR